MPYLYTITSNNPHRSYTTGATTTGGGLLESLSLSLPPLTTPTPAPHSAAATGAFGTPERTAVVTVAGPVPSLLTVEGACVACVGWFVCVCGRVVRAEKQHGLVYSRRVSCLTKSPTAKFFLFLSLSHLITYICTPPYIYTYTCIKHTPVLAPRESYEIEFRERSVREWCSKVDCLCLYIDIDGWPALLFFTTGAQRRDRSFAYTYTIQHRHARVGSWGYGWTRSPCPCASSG